MGRRHCRTKQQEAARSNADGLFTPNLPRASLCHPIAGRFCKNKIILCAVKKFFEKMQIYSVLEIKISHIKNVTPQLPFCINYLTHLRNIIDMELVYSTIH